MGEIADDMIDGTSCQLCGQYFQKDDELFTHGHPVVCKDCWGGLSKTEKKTYIKAEADTF